MNLLFHCTDEYTKLKSIIENGFYPSYAKETFAGRNQKLLMVSFSYKPIEDEIKEGVYGKYKIGVELEWAKKNNVHPVHYTFEGSYYEQAVVDLIEITTAAHCLSGMLKLRDANCKIETKGFFLEQMKELTYSGITDAQAQKIEAMLHYIAEDNLWFHFFTKNYEVKLSDGKPYVAFFDREWRYIPKNGIDNTPLLIFEESFGVKSKEYENWNSDNKPHGKNIPLKIGIDDVKYIVVETKPEIAEITNLLCQRYGEEKIKSLLNMGLLNIKSFE